MGNRANIYVADQTEDPLTKERAGIFLYTHWNGSEWPERLRRALAAGRGRWGDPQYLTRILIREVFAELDGDTGGGVSTEIGDGNGVAIVCDVVNDAVYFAGDVPADPTTWHGRMTFEEYVAQDRADYPNS